MATLKNIAEWMGGGFSFFVYAAIVLLFLIGIFKCVLPVARNRSLLVNAVKNIKKGDKARRSWQEEKFLGRGSLLPHWSEYLNNLFFADGEYHNPANVEDYINEETVIDGPGAARLSEALPGVLVSLGFLGTLLGLSVALSQMNAVDADGITTSMATLLSSMKYAFLTSIFGVIASVSFTIIMRIAHGRAEKALLMFYNAMARYAGVLSVDPMTQVAIYQQEQTTLLKELISYLDGDRLSELVKPVMEGVSKTVDMTCEAQQRLMDQVATAYIDKMNTAFHGQIEALTQTIETTCRYQERTTREVADALAGVTDAKASMREIRTDALTLIDRMDRLLARIEQSAADNARATSETRALVDVQTQYMNELGDIRHELEEHVKTIRKATEDCITYSETLLTDTSNVLKAAGMELSSTLNTARNTLDKDMRESAGYFEEMLTQLIRRLEKASKSVRESAEDMPRAFSDATSGYVKELTALTKALADKRAGLR